MGFSADVCIVVGEPIYFQMNEKRGSASNLILGEVTSLLAGVD